MENTLTQFNAGNLEIKLTSERLFFKTAVSSEAFALRSINGIGVVDLVEDYNKAFAVWNNNKILQWLYLTSSIIILLVGLISLANPESVIGGLMAMALGGFFTFIFIDKVKKHNDAEPKLMSVVRIMMSGGNRDFQFEKTGVKTGNIAEFVASVELTLTAYHNNK